MHLGWPELAAAPAGAREFLEAYEGTLRRSYVLHDERYDIDVLSLVGAELDGVGLS